MKQTRRLPKLKNPKVDKWDNDCGAYVGRNKINFTRIWDKFQEMVYVFLWINGKRINNAYWLPIKSRRKKDLIKVVEDARLLYKKEQQ